MSKQAQKAAKDGIVTDEMLREAAQRKMTPQERRDQAVSYALGMVGSRSGITEAQVRQIVEEKYGPVTA